MTDLRDRFRTFDGIASPALWTDIEARAVAMHRSPSRWLPIVVVAAVVLVLAIIGGALSIGSNGLAGPRATALPGNSAPPSTGRSQHVGGAWSRTGPMADARLGHSATLLPDGTVLVAGGMIDDVGLTSAELYDPQSGSWTSTGNMRSGRGHHSATLLRDGTVLVVGGISRRDDAGETMLASAERYDPRTGSWTATGTMVEARTGGAPVLLPDGHVLIAGGWGVGQGFGPKLSSAEIYDPATGTWAATGSMAKRRHGHGAVLLQNGLVLAAGGNDQVRLASAELYDPVSGSWTFTGGLPEAGFGASLTLLPNGMVLAAGGDVPRGPGAVGSAHAAIYDPVSGTWATVAEMLTPRLSHAVVLLRDGRVLVTGGRVNGTPDSPATFSSAEVYDPVAGMWTAAADMAGTRSGHTVTLLPDGRVLVAGGATGAGLGIPLRSAERFDPDGGS